MPKSSVSAGTTPAAASVTATARVHRVRRSFISLDGNVANLLIVVW